MISMTDYSSIISLRNKGKTQAQIASQVGCSVSTVGRYLRDGKVPVYKRSNKSNRKDPLDGYYDIIKEKLQLEGNILLDDLFEYIQMKGYTGSARTLRRKTKKLRDYYKSKEVFFQREVSPNEIMEGDFTEYYVEIAGVKRKTYIWVTSLPYSNRIHATPFYNCTFECFAEGSMKAFENFSGTAKTYRLDNMSPVVKKVLKGKDREITQKFASFKDHYGLTPDFCSPGRGNEKGNVESNNKHLKRKITSRINLYNKKFETLEQFQEFLWKLCDELNRRDKVVSKFSIEKLNPLPVAPFRAFRSIVVSISKYSLFSLDNTGHMYSVPSNLIGLYLEVRVYTNKIQVIHEQEKVCEHKRLYGPKGIASIQLEHIIDGLIKKPGAIKDWKYRDLLFEKEAWKRFYERLIKSGGRDKDYLKCLKLVSTHGRELVTTAMELALEEDVVNLSFLEELLEGKESLDLSPLNINLDSYDHFLQGEIHGDRNQFASNA